MKAHSVILIGLLTGLGTTAAGQTMQQQRAGNPQRALLQEPATCAMGTRLVDRGYPADYCSEYAAGCPALHNYVVDVSGQVDSCKKVTNPTQGTSPVCSVGGSRQPRAGHDACVGGGARPTCRSGYRLWVKPGEDNCIEQ